MTDSWYVAILEKNSEGLVFATIPDLPGVNASGATKAEALALATEFAADYVRDLVDDGHPIPEPRDIDNIEVDLSAPEIGRALIPVDIPGRTVKISLSIDEALLKRVDRAAAKAGTSRSGFFAAAAETRIATTSLEMARTRVREAMIRAKAGEPIVAEDDVFLRTLDLRTLDRLALTDETHVKLRASIVKSIAEVLARTRDHKAQIITGDAILSALAKANFVVPTTGDEENELER